MTAARLEAIRRRAARPQRNDELVTEEHADCAADRRDLLEYVDSLTIEIKDIHTRVASALEASKLLLGFRILADGHARNLGEAIRIAEHPDRVRELYPDGPA